MPDDDMMGRFRSDYLALLDDRVATIRAEIDTGNDLTAQVALLSLESSSAMIGAAELKRVVGALRSAVEHGRRHEVSALVTAMTSEATRLREELRPTSHFWGPSESDA